MASRLVAVPCSQLATRQQDSLQVGDVVLLTRRKNPGQVEVGCLSQFIYRGLIYPNGGCLGFLNHQQYCFALKFAKFLEDERSFEDVVSCDMAMGQWTHLLGWKAEDFV